MLRWPFRRASVRGCAVCGGAGVARFARQAPYSVWRCPDCGFVSNLRDRGATTVSGAQPDHEFAQLTWTGKPYRDSLEEFVAYYDPLLSTLESWVSPGRLLDVGCGPGFFLEAARRRGWQVLGVDPSPFSAPYVADRFGLEVLPARLEESRLPEASFDAVSFVHSIEHLPDPAGALSTVATLLRPAGALFIETPNIECDSARLHGAEWPFLNPVEHTCLFSPASLALLLRKAGFRLLELVATARAALPRGSDNMLRAWAERPGPPCATRLDAMRGVERWCDLSSLASEASPPPDGAPAAGRPRAGMLPWGDGALDLDAWVTRAEVAMLLAAALGLGGNPDPQVPPFPDVPRSHRAWLPIHLLRREGIVAGLYDGSFRPEQFLLKTQLEQLVARAEQWQARRAAESGSGAEP